MGFIKLTNDTLSCLTPGCVYNFINVKYLKKTLYYSPIHAQYTMRIMNVANIEKVTNPVIITNHQEKSLTGLIIIDQYLWSFLKTNPTKYQKAFHL